MKRKLNLELDKGLHQLREILLDDNEEYVNEKFDDNSDIEHEDLLEICGISSESEQEDCDRDEDSSNSEYFLGKDKMSKWYKNPFPKTRIMGPENILK